MTRSVRPRRGMTLLLVLSITVVLAAVGVGAASITRTSAQLVHTHRVETRLRSAAESAVAEAEQRLAAMIEAAAQEGTSPLPFAELSALPAFRRIKERDGIAVALALRDHGAQLDVNLATEEQLTSLFLEVGAPMATAERMARAIGSGPSVVVPPELSERPAAMFPSVDVLFRLPAIDTMVLTRALPYLTVDGDGSVNRVTASDTVLRVAGGQLRTTPSRISVVANASVADHGMQWELEQVYAVDERRLVRVARREREQ